MQEAGPAQTDGSAIDEDDEAKYAHLRAEARDSMFLAAQLRRPGGAWLQVKVRNLSAGGMMAEAPASFIRGEPVEIELRGVGAVHGKVAWAAGGRIGVAFDRPVDPRLARKPVVGKAPLPMVQTAISTRRPGLR